MIVTRSNFDGILERLRSVSKLALDTETTGLRPWHGDRLFSIIIASLEGGDPPRVTPYYFNFQPYAAEPDVAVLLPTHMRAIGTLFKDPAKTWYLHNAKYDLAILFQEGLPFPTGTIHCTRAIARVEYNEHLAYDLSSCAERIGFKKDDTVEKYIDEHTLWTWADIPGKKQRKKLKHFDRLPFSIVQPYGEIDAVITAHLGHGQEKTLDAVSADMPAGITPINNIVHNERRLTKTLFRMEARGVLIDKPYCERAQAYEQNRASKAVAAFKAETGRDFSASNKLFQEVFADQREHWSYTEKGNPSFESDVLSKFGGPTAAAVLAYRDAKSKCDFYAGLLYHADSAGVVHTNFNTDGTGTGRSSSSDPNLQNLTSESAAICRACKEEHEDLAKMCAKCGSSDMEYPEFLVRRAIIPRPGHIFIMPDYDQMEYRMMLDYAQEVELIEKVKGGLDIHQATAQMMGVTRKEAKTLNFMLLYGGGAQKLADALGIPLEKAQALKARYFQALPGVMRFIKHVQDTIYTRGYIRNWAGRRCYFPDVRRAYKGPNYLIQGGCADVNKFGLNAIDEYLLDKMSKLVLTIHDENPIEVHESEAHFVPREVQKLMESVYPGKRLGLTVGMEWSAKSLGDKVKGFPAA